MPNKDYYFNYWYGPNNRPVLVVGLEDLVVLLAQSKPEEIYFRSSDELWTEGDSHLYVDL